MSTGVPVAPHTNFVNISIIFCHHVNLSLLSRFISSVLSGTSCSFPRGTFVPRVLSLYLYFPPDPGYVFPCQGSDSPIGHFLPSYVAASSTCNHGRGPLSWFGLSCPSLNNNRHLVHTFPSVPVIELLKYVLFLWTTVANYHLHPCTSNSPGFFFRQSVLPHVGELINFLSPYHC